MGRTTPPGAKGIDDSEAARRDLIAYEDHLGPLAGVELDWIRNSDQLNRLITAERAAMAPGGRPLTHYDLGEVLGQPLPKPDRLGMAEPQGRSPTPTPGRRPASTTRWSSSRESRHSN